MKKVRAEEAKAKAYWGLEVLSDGEVEETSEVDPDDEWSRPDIQHSLSIHGLRMVGAGTGTEDLVACFEPIAGERLHLLSVRYGTGDSLHHESGLVAFVAVFRTLRMAQLARAELELAGTEEATVGIFDEDGSVKVVHARWAGYFESFEGAAIDSFEVAPAREPKPQARSAAKRGAR